MNEDTQWSKLKSQQVINYSVFSFTRIFVEKYDKFVLNVFNVLLKNIVHNPRGKQFRIEHGAIGIVIICRFSIAVFACV